MAFVIKPAVEEDVRAIAEINLATWRTAFRGVIPDVILDGLSIDKREAGFKKIVSQSVQPVPHAEVAIEDGELVGFVVYGGSRDEDAQPGTGEIYAIYVRQECWGRGAGRLLIEHARASLAASGSLRITLWTLAAVARTVRFYVSAGFEADGATKTVELNGEKVEHVRFMVKI